MSTKLLYGYILVRVIYIEYMLYNFRIGRTPLRVDYSIILYRRNWTCLSHKLETELHNHIYKTRNKIRNYHYIKKRRFSDKYFLITKHYVGIHSFVCMVYSSLYLYSVFYMYYYQWMFFCYKSHWMFVIICFFLIF